MSFLTCNCYTIINLVDAYINVNYCDYNIISLYITGLLKYNATYNLDNKIFITKAK